MAKTPTDKALEEALADVATTELRDRVTSIANRMLDQVEDTLEYGAPDTKMALVSRFFPHMVKAMAKEEGVDEEMEQQAEEFRGMLAKMMGGDADD